MKKTLLTTVLSCLILTACASTTNTSNTTQQSANLDPAHSAENSLDWDGTYKGLFPCADCSGIKTVLRLTNDHHYELIESYQGKGDENTFKVHGSFSFDKTGSIITLDKKSDNRKYFVGENVLIALDQNGAEITGPLAEHYKLQKVTN